MQRLGLARTLKACTAKRYLSTSSPRWSTQSRGPQATEQQSNDSQSAGPSVPNPESTSKVHSALDELRDRLRLWAQLNANLFRTRASSASASLSQLGGQLNQLTGYDQIEALKRQVTQNELGLEASRKAAKESRIAYEAAVAARSACQREINDLLQRKLTWSDADVTRYTSLVHQDHLNAHSETSKKNDTIETEQAVDQNFQNLIRSILGRYHEEQVWSDKIRSASTYGSLLALGLNLVVFILAIVVVEPWKRRRLAETFEKRIEQMAEENRALIQESMFDLGRHFERQEKVLGQLVESGDDKSPTETRAVSTSLSTEAVDPALAAEKLTMSARDRESWMIGGIAGVAGAVGAIGGALLTSWLFPR